MGTPKSLIVIVAAGLGLTACGTAPATPEPRRSEVESAATPTSNGVSTTPLTSESLYPSGFDPAAYRPPEHWKAPCKAAYLRLAVGLLANWNAIRNLIERTGNSAYHTATIKFSYEQLVDSPQKEILRACQQADPVIGARFERGVAAAGTAMSIVCREAEPSTCARPELSAEERAMLSESVQPLLAAVPPKR
ncbi:hypothetical protein [Streptosporangium carneum]|uniref:DUF3558 domain-containing protein n=1 Tax=Streptosporangium carneum TaxID=47481 RepID=A0A9W6MHP0_9ACTN|nr:hypothetical protein [Streptosporangium carneum]GLK14397.1 hypothetical protein GCM10017600_78090 [Streptosporangium carneum]